MTQTLPISIILGASNTGKLIGFHVLNLDRTEYAAFALATESDVPGTYYADGGYSAPDAGGYVVVSESDGGDPAVLTAIAETDIESSSANVTTLMGATEPLDNLVLSLGNGGLVEKLNSMLEAAGADYRFTAEALAEAPTGTGTGLYTDTVTVRVSGLPVDGALVQVATDSAFANIVRSGYTNSLGQVTFQYDSVGTYYGRAELAGFNIATFTITVST